jgi:head-tail adaptor
LALPEVNTAFGKNLKQLGNIVEILKPSQTGTDEYGNPVREMQHLANVYAHLRIFGENERILIPGSTERAEAVGFFESTVEIAAGYQVKTAGNGDWQVLYVKKLTIQAGVHHIEALLKRLEA